MPKISDREESKSLLIGGMAKLAEAHGVDLGTALEDVVEGLKKEEATAINNSGVHRQIAYILDAYGPAMLRDARERVEEKIRDDPCARGMTLCCECGEMEFSERATETGQSHLCEKCAE
jgi:formylmethanofuran dehydrogenase subunit E